jgi:RNA polymerase sigma-70 factor (ECF subfamily)
MARYLLDNGEYVGEKWPDEETIASIYSIIRSDISPQARRIMELRFSQEMPFARIAAEMGISETAVYRHLSHALRIIRQKLSENG